MASQASPLLIRFGVFEADLRAGELRRNGAKVRLQDLPFRALCLLLSRPGELITRQELREALWAADVFVDFEQGISSAVMRLRTALNDSAENPIFIQTVERRGYRWIGPLHTLESAREKLEEERPPEVPSSLRLLQAKSFWWRPFVFAVPLLLLAFWILRPRFRSAAAGSVPSIAHTPTREAEDFYLKGRFYWNKRTPESLNQAVDAFTQAIVHDPNYADAYVGLADCYNLLREFAAMPANEAFSRAFAAAKTAVELNDQSSEAHASLAFVTFWGMWDAPGAEKEFRRAIELHPSNAKAHHWFATFLHALGRHQEALAEIDIARKLDPHSSSILADKGELLKGAGRREEAMQILQQLEAAEPDFTSPHRYLEFAYLASDDYSNYILELKKEALLTHDDSLLAQARAAEKGLAAGGKRGLLERQLEEQKKLYQQRRVSPYFLALSELSLGNAAESLKYLEACIQSHDGYVLAVRGDYAFAGLRGNPDFEKLVARISRPRSTEQ